MKDKIILIAIFTVFLSIVPLFSPVSAKPPDGEKDDRPNAQNPTDIGQADGDDVVFSVFNTTTGEAMELEGKDYIVHVVAAEMPASFETEALKAQAVAAFTYAVNRKSFGTATAEHEGCELCTDSTHCKAYADTQELEELWGKNFDFYYSKISAAVDEVYGRYLSYEGEPISAVFHALSSGVTESAKDTWGHDYPYLVSVDSSTDKQVKGYETTVTVDKAEFKRILKEYSSKCDFSADPKKWVTEEVRSDAGGVMLIDLCGVSMTGGTVRKLFGLRSPNFTVTYSGGEFTFTVHGYGHGVGMSQYGANALAQQGYTYDEILLHYYTGVKLESAVKGIGKFS